MQRQGLSALLEPSADRIRRHFPYISVFQGPCYNVSLPISRSRTGGNPPPLAPHLVSKIAMNTDAAETACPVHSYNEWGRLEEILVGRIDQSAIPTGHFEVIYRFPPWKRFIYRFASGRRYPGFLRKPAMRELEEFVRILEVEGVKVRRPEIIDYRRPYRTPNWKSRGLASACPRDSVLVIGDQLIETPMAWRARYFETFAYRKLFKEYFRQGARWVSAPKPQLLDESYKTTDYVVDVKGKPVDHILTEFEPLFDAADFARCGRDIFYVISNTTNELGVEWLRRHLGDDYRFHKITTTCPRPMHIDNTFVPVSPGKAFVNPDWVKIEDLPEITKSWDIRYGPEPDERTEAVKHFQRFSMVSKWINLNVMMIDEKRVVVDASQKGTMKFFKEWGIEPIPCPFANYMPFGGSFHCATLDIHRHGGLESYFD